MIQVTLWICQFSAQVTHLARDAQLDVAVLTPVVRFLAVLGAARYRRAQPAQTTRRRVFPPVIDRLLQRAVAWQLADQADLG